MTEAAAGGSRARSLADLLSREDEAFVRCAYVSLLGREPDPEGLGHHLERVRGGESKRRLLAQLRASPEGRAFGASFPGLQALEGEACAWSSAQDVLALQDRAFVQAAYGVLLCREPDEEGLDLYVRRLREGEPKESLLDEIGASPEAVALGRVLSRWRECLEDASAPVPAAREAPAQGCAVPELPALLALPGEAFAKEACRVLAGSETGPVHRRAPPRVEDAGGRLQWLREAWHSPGAKAVREAREALRARVRRYCRGRIPVLGWFYRHWHGLEGDGERERRQRRLENRLAVVEEMVSMHEAAPAGARAPAASPPARGGGEDTSAARRSLAASPGAGAAARRLRTLSAHGALKRKDA